MSPEIIDAVLPALFWGVVGLAILLAGHRWGLMAARQAVNARSPKWKAYALGLLVPTTIAVSIYISGPQHFDLAFRIFWLLSSPVVVGVGFGYSRYRTDLG